jgi:hypothetical protein
MESILPKYCNVRPAMKNEIPWPWKTYGMEKCPEIFMPDITSYYDWQTFMIEDVSESPTLESFGTRNFKSIFTTAGRFIGLERLLTEVPKIDQIIEEFSVWNRTLVRHCPIPLTRFVVGDILGDEYDSYLKPDLFHSWILPGYQELKRIAERADIAFYMVLKGDISSLLTDILTLQLTGLAFEPTGGMARFKKEKTFDGCALFPMEKF